MNKLTSKGESSSSSEGYAVEAKRAKRTILKRRRLRTQFLFVRSSMGIALNRTRRIKGGE